MSSAQSLREFITERLTAAAAEIFSEYEKTVVRYEEEIDRQRRLLEISWKPQINLHRIELPLHYLRKDEEVQTDQQLWNQERTSSLDQEQPEPLQEEPEPPQMKVEQDEPEPLQILEQEELCVSQNEEQFVLEQETVISLVTPPADEKRDHDEPEPDKHQLLLTLLPEAEIRDAASPGSTDVQQKVLVKEESPEEQSAGVDQEDPDHLHIKEKQEELLTSLEGERLHLKEETDAARFQLTAVSIKREDDEEKTLFSQLHQQQVEDRDVPTSYSADQMTAETGGGAETSRNPDLNPHEQAYDSSETEVSGDDVNLDSELSDSGSETGDEDSYWNENRSSESDGKTVNQLCSCPECGEIFFHKSSLQEHMRVTSHSAIRSSGSLVSKKCVGVKHVDSCRKVQKEQKTFSCDDCGRTFGKKSNVNGHMRVHTGQKRFSCELCGQRFSREVLLNRHTRVHSREKPFACEHCEQKFSNKSTLNRHMRVHTGPKPFVCELCGQRFRVKATLNTHMRVHTGQKPFACDLCGQRFRDKSTLNRHMRVHTGRKELI